MNVSLTKELEQMVSEQVRSGRFNNASEVVRAGLRLLEHAEQERSLKITRLRTEVAIGIRQSKAGLSTPFVAADIMQAGRKLLRGGSVG
jgi:putative addiction module CopG family antidote